MRRAARCPPAGRGGAADGNRYLLLGRNGRAAVPPAAPGGQGEQAGGDGVATGEQGRLALLLRNDFSFLVTVFAAIDHKTAECVGIHATKNANRFEALEPIRQGVRAAYGSYAASQPQILADGPLTRRRPPAVAVHRGGGPDCVYPNATTPSPPPINPNKAGSICEIRATLPWATLSVPVSEVAVGMVRFAEVFMDAPA